MHVPVSCDDDGAQGNDQNDRDVDTNLEGDVLDFSEAHPVVVRTIEVRRVHEGAVGGEWFFLDHLQLVGHFDDD